MQEEPIKVYIAGDWLNPPIKLAKRFEERGFSVPHKWWKDRPSHKANVPLLLEEITDCDRFVFDMRSPDIDKQKFGGSHIGAGIALALGKDVRVILSIDTKKPFTSLLAPYVTKNEESVFKSTTQ